MNKIFLDKLCEFTHTTYKNYNQFNSKEKDINVQDQIEIIKDDLSFRLGVDLLEDLVEGYDDEDDDKIVNNNEDETEDDVEDTFISPYDIGGN